MNKSFINIHKYMFKNNFIDKKAPNCLSGVSERAVNRAFNLLN